MTDAHPSLEGARAHLRHSHAFARLLRAVPAGNDDVVEPTRDIAKRVADLAAEAEAAGLAEAAAVYRAAARVEEWTLRSAQEHPDGVPPIWDRQGRPKPPTLESDSCIGYAWKFGRLAVIQRGRDWLVVGKHDGPVEWSSFKGALQYATRTAASLRESAA